MVVGTADANTGVADIPGTANITALLTGPLTSNAAPPIDPAAITQGNRVTTFAVPIPIEFKYNAANVAQASGNANSLTGAYVIDGQTPAIANPNNFSLGTFVVFPAQNVSLNSTAGTLLVTTQAIGSTIVVVTNPVEYVQTLKPTTPELSSFDTDSSQTFADKPQFSYLRVVEPQIGTRLMVLDADTGNYAYVNATDVGPSGPPPATSSSAVVRGIQPVASGMIEARQAGLTPGQLPDVDMVAVHPGNGYRGSVADVDWAVAHGKQAIVEETGFAGRDDRSAKYRAELDFWWRHGVSAFLLDGFIGQGLGDNGNGDSVLGFDATWHTD